MRGSLGASSANQRIPLCIFPTPTEEGGGGHADPFVHPRIQRCILTQNLWSMFTKTKFPRKLGTVLIWNFYEIFLRPLGTALSYFFPSKLLILVNLGWFLLGARHEFIFWDARKDPQMHKRIRRCTKGSADARKDPQMHERIRLAYPPPPPPAYSYWNLIDSNRL